jgi:hypothetical protein
MSVKLGRLTLTSAPLWCEIHSDRIDIAWAGATGPAALPFSDWSSFVDFLGRLTEDGSLKPRPNLERTLARAAERHANPLPGELRAKLSALLLRST